MRWLILSALATGCFYSPNVADCVNTCGPNSACPENLSCVEGFCRTPGATTTCPKYDAAVDAAPQMDAPMTPIDATCPYDADPDAGCILACVEPITPRPARATAESRS